ARVRDGTLAGASGWCGAPATQARGALAVSIDARPLIRSFMLLMLGATLAAGGATADLGAAPRASMELRLSRLLLPGTERHGAPRSLSLVSSFRAMPPGPSTVFLSSCNRLGLPDREKYRTPPSRRHARDLGDEAELPRVPRSPARGAINPSSR